MPSRGALLPIRVLGWFVASLSLLNLLRDMTLVNLRGLLSEWLGAYSALIHRIGTALFGWLTWIQPAEYHVLVLAVLIGGAAARAAHRTNTRPCSNPPSGPAPAQLDAWGSVQAAFGVPVFLGAILCASVSPPASVHLGIYGLSLIAIACSIKRTNEALETTFDASDFRIELIGVFATLILLIIINHIFLSL
jgi:hypothetical protein